MTRVLVQCEGAPIPQVHERARWDKRLVINRDGAKPNLTLRVQELSDTLHGAVRQEPLDLVRIATYAYAADQLVSRGGSADLYGRDWRRTFVVCLPTSIPDLWSMRQVAKALSDTLGYASDDDWTFVFSGACFDDQLAFDLDPHALRSNPDSVLCFSSGADSMCAAVQADLVGEHPVLLSHCPEPGINHRQKALVSELRDHFPRWYFPHTSIEVHKTGVRERDTTQRTRGFLYASLAAAVASALELPRVTLADNGIVSLNLLINGQLLGALASRSTHPRFIDRFNTLLGNVLPNAPVLQNPFLFKTRPEVLDVLHDAGAEPLLQETRSCASARRMESARPHCGVCSQCIDRRFAVLATDLTTFDAVWRYQTDIFRDALTGTARTMAESYVRFAREVVGLSAEELLTTYPQLVEAIVPGDRRPAHIAKKLADHVHRHAAATLSILMGIANLAEIARRLIAGGRVAETPTALVEQATTPRQRCIVATLDTIAQEAEAAGAASPAIVVVGEVVQLRERLQWFEARPLWGRRVLVTRTRRQASGLRRLLEERGAEVLELPALEIVETAKPEVLERIGEALAAGEYAWTIFTSANGVQLFFRRLREQGRDARAFNGCGICAIGPGTAQALSEQGIVADVVPDEYVAEGVLAAMQVHDLRRRRVLVPRAENARPELIAGLRRLGAEVEEVPLYAARLPAQPDEGVLGRVRRGEVDVVTLASSSTVTHLLQMLGGDPAALQSAVIACIGPVTANTARRLGLRVDVEADEHSIPGLVAALEAHLADGSREENGGA